LEAPIRILRGCFDMRNQLLVLAFMLMTGLAPLSAAAQADARSGMQVVETVCAECHASGANGAPKIGDANAWERRAARGLASLTESALRGIRNINSHGGNPGQWRPTAARAQWRPGEMPARGGNPNLSDLEIQRAITFMVNASGGQWTEP
jgi:cytochrome c5